LGQPCCDGACNDPVLDVCDTRINECITRCGHRFQPCCNGSNCNGGLVCASGICNCGGNNQPCCAPGGTCGQNLSCTNGFCVSGSSSCGQCTNNRQLCNNRCPPTDALCHCLCQNSYCSCVIDSGCGTCIFDDCGALQ
jgi:hypothetical protein